MNELFWWEARIFGGETILLKPDEAEVVMLAKKANDSVMIPRLKMQIDTRQVVWVEQTDQPFDNDRKLASGSGSSVAEIPLPGGQPDSVAATYVKRRVSRRVWERLYAGAPGYFALPESDDDGGEVWMVFTRPVYPSGLPRGLHELEGWELKIVERRFAGTR
jgi:hypothetical protein